jgi:hypothetical protein
VINSGPENESEMGNGRFHITRVVINQWSVDSVEGQGSRELGKGKKQKGTGSGDPRAGG